MQKTKYSDLAFVSHSDAKAAEYRLLLAMPHLRHCKEEFDEAQGLDLEKLVLDKVKQIKDRGSVSLPFFVEHTELRIDSWGRLPGGLTRHFMEQVGPAGICKMMTAYKGKERIARLRTVIGYCPTDGSPHIIEGTAVGTIAPEPRFGPDFAWDFDQIFIPDGDPRTYAEMGRDEKNQISMRRRAATNFLNEYLLRDLEAPDRRKTGTGSRRQRKSVGVSGIQQSTMPHLSAANGRTDSLGDICAFVGAGLSVGAGLPGWYDLISELSGRIDYKLAPREWATGDSLIDAAQACVNRQGLHSLISHLKDRLDTTGKQPTAAHRALAALPISLVFTANFDDLLERAFRDAGKRVEVVVKDSSIPFMRRGPDTVNIVKLYGDLDQPDTIVLARQQYESYFLQRPQMVKLLETELARSDMLYLGWSGSDPYFKLVFGELLSRFGPMMRPGYAVMFDVTDDQRDELRRKQIRLVELPAGDRTASLAKWLENLTPPSAPAGPTGGKGDGAPSGAPQTVLNTGKAWAVLVGVNQYENRPHIPPLHVCVDDVTAVHAALSSKYTAARLLTDDTPERLPTRANILGELNSVAQAAGEGDLLLFYFSGHGIAEGGESYLLPRDARLSALKHTAVAMKDVREIVEASPARAKVIVLDACHSGAAIGKAATMTPEFIQRVFTEAEGMAVLASCKQGQQSWEWPEGGRSVFTHFLLEALNGKADFDGKGFVTVSDAGRYVTDGVKAWAVDHGVPQTPTLQYTVAGDIVLLQV